MRCDDITFVIFTFNEEARVERAVRNFISTGPVLVVDNHSGDRTSEIASAAGARVLRHKNPGWVEDEDTIAVVKQAVQTPWLYWAYSDEIVDRATMDALIETVQSGKHAVINIARKNYFYGVFCHDAYRNTQNRAFLKDAIDFTANRIHHFGKVIVPESAIKRLDPDRYFVHHFISNTAKSYMRSLDGYTDIEATDALPVSPAKLTIRMLRSFVGNYFALGGYKAGKAGFYLCLQMTFYYMLLAAKVYERDQALTTRTIEDRNNGARDTLIADLHGGACRK